MGSRAAPTTLLLALVLLALPPLAEDAAASQPRFDYMVSFAARGAPEPGEPFELVATARADQGGRIDLRLSVPDHVLVKGDLAWLDDVGPREVRQRTWTLTATEEGLWSARLLTSDGERTRACCLYARTYEGDSRAGGAPAAALEPVRVDHSLHATALDDERVRLTYAVTPESDWARELRLVLSFHVDGPADAFDPGEAARLHKEVALAEGGRVEVPLRAEGVAFFDTRGGPLEDFGGETIPIRCTVAVLERTGENVTWTESRSCHPSGSPGLAPRGWRAVAAPAAAPTGALLLLAALLLARRRP